MLYCRVGSSKRRTFWPEDQSARVKTVFAKEIAMRTVPGMDRCNDVLHQFPHCGTGPRVYRKLAWKVNNLITKSKGRKPGQRRDQLQQELEQVNDSDSA